VASPSSTPSLWIATLTTTVELGDSRAVVITIAESSDAYAQLALPG